MAKLKTKAARTPPVPLSAHREGLIAWLLDEARFYPRTREVIEQLCQRLVAAGVPLMRVVVNVRTIHPQIFATNYRWERGGKALIFAPGHDIVNDPEYLNSPFKMIHDGAGGIRRRLEDADVEMDFPVLKSLKAEGATDYLVAPIVFGDGVVNAVSFATDRPGGFSLEELGLLYDLLPILTLILEAQSIRRMATALLDTYLGHQAGKRVLQGEILRGSGETIHAVIAYCDLRGFTAMSETLPRDEIIALLNDYFERVIQPVHDHGGQVLKLIGDGMLAIFPLGDPAFRPYVCRNALDAARDAERAIDDLNKTRAGIGKPALRFGFALHLGDVMYGNIGAPNRLDFTVIGAAVNNTARIEEMSAGLGVTVIVSEVVAQASGRELLPLGSHTPRGAAKAQALYTLPADTGLPEPESGGAAKT